MQLPWPGLRLVARLADRRRRIPRRRAPTKELTISRHRQQPQPDDPFPRTPIEHAAGRPAVGRHVRAASRLVALAGAIAIVLAFVLLIAVSAVAGAAGTVVAAVVVGFGARRVIAAYDADEREELWLRQALNGLGADLVV
jgi:Flp pilus assembly protein TadB